MSKEPKFLTFEEAIEMLDEGIPTVIIPCFLSTNRSQYIREVLKRCQHELETPELSRIYLLFQEGISRKSAHRCWEQIIKKGQHSLKSMDLARLQVHSFGNIPTEILRMFIEETPQIEVVKEGTDVSG